MPVSGDFSPCLALLFHTFIFCTFGSLVHSHLGLPFSLKQPFLAFKAPLLICPLLCWFFFLSLCVFSRIPLFSFHCSPSRPCLWTFSFVFTTSCAGHLSSDVLFKVLADWVCPLESTMDSKESIVLFAPRLIPPSFSPFWGMTSLPVYLLKSET
jgi:hypothetical protein